MKKSIIIKRTLLLLLTALAVIYWKPLIHLMAWLLILYWIVRFLLRMLTVFTPMLVFLAVLYILFKY